MGLYDVVLGDGNQAERGRVLLGLLGGMEAPRYRDAWVETSRDGPVIAVYTRTGGGNREGYAAANGVMAAHPLYLWDADDEFDSTYATWYFKAPEQYRDALARVAEPPVNMSGRWREAINRLERGEFRPAETALMDQMAAFLSEPGDGPRVMEV